MRRRRWAEVAAWAVLIESLILWPSPPDVRSPFGSVGLDKILHATMFGVLAVLAARALRDDGQPWWLALVGTSAFGAFTELQQYFIPTRSTEVGDFLADTAGAAIGLALFAALAPRRRELHR